MSFYGCSEAKELCVAMNRESHTQTFAGCYWSDSHNALLGPNGNIRSLRRQSLAVLQCLLSREGAVVEKHTIITEVWKGIEVTDDSLVQCVSEIRKTLGDTHHSVLKTVPRRGYCLLADKQMAKQDLQVKQYRQLSDLGFWPILALLLMVVFMLAANVLFTDVDDSGVLSAVRPTLGIVGTTVVTDEYLSTLHPELRISLNRYQNVKLSKHTDVDYQIQLDTLGSDVNVSRLSVELVSRVSHEVIFAERYESELAQNSIHQLAIRIAAAVASPGVGAIDRHLLSQSRLKPVSQLSRSECYANGYGCAKCSGEEDNITRRAELCLANILNHDPNDSRAWALQATIYAHQYWWGNTLREPQKSNHDLRRELPQKAIDAANRAESLSDGNDSSVYWGMAEAYFASCQPDKLKTAISRGLALNPDDPNLLAAFGNWLSYSGHWDEGAALTQRALAIEPQHYRKWWWMGIAKTHYFKGEFGEAYRAFMKAFNERNWVSHLQLAYTLPHLNRMSEARVAVQNLQKLSPGITIERALEVYEILCFPDSFLSTMKVALMQAGLPSLGDSQDFENIVLPRAKTIDINGLTVEYLDEGEGEPVLFVHGAVSDYRSWGHYLVPISKNHRYVSFSQRYHGTQAWQDEGERWSKDQFAIDLIQFIEALNLSQVHLVSWSNGVQAAAKVAIDRPDLIKSVTHYEPVDHDIFTGDDSISIVQKNHFDLWAPVFKQLEVGDSEEAAKRLLELVFKLPKGGYESEREIQREVVRQNARTMPLLLGRRPDTDTKQSCDFFKQTNVPTQIVQGSLTLPYYTRLAQRYTDCIPSATLETILGTNHRGPIERVDELSRVILAFVENHQ